MVAGPGPEWVWVAAGVGAYGTAAVLAWWSRGRGEATLAAHGMSTALAVGVVILAWAVAQRWRHFGQGPFMTLYEVLLSNLFTLGTVALAAYALSARARTGARAVLAVLVLLGAWTLSLPTEPVMLPPTFDNPWLWVHVVTGKIFLGTCLVAVGIASYLLARWRRMRVTAAGAPDVRALDVTVWQFMSIAFVFHSGMLLAGAVWAHDAWGRYWAWDPLETWSFITWLALAVVLHLRVTVRLALPLGWVLALAVFALAILTFFGVPFLSRAPHQGVF